MRTIHVGRNGQNLGTFPEDQIPGMVQAGQLLPSDMAWTEGMGSWQPLSSVVALGIAPAGVMQPISPQGAPQTLGYMTQTEDRRPLPWQAPRRYLIIWLVCNVPTLLLQLAFVDYENQALTEVWVSLSIRILNFGALISGILMIVYGAILHYRCWKLVPAQFRKTSPGLAVGLMFIPLFHMYWVVVSFVGLAKSIKAWSESIGRPFSDKIITLGSAVALALNLFIISQVVIFVSVFNAAFEAARSRSVYVPGMTVILLPGVIYILLYSIAAFFYRDVVRQSHSNADIGTTA